MQLDIDKYKGIHPGLIIGRELKKRGVSQRAFAATIGEHSQTLNAIIRGRRSLTLEQAYKLERELGYGEGDLAMLQTVHDFEQVKRRIENARYPGRPNIRRVVFWDTNFDKIEWGYRKQWIINRILERGNAREREEIARFYGLTPSELDNFTD
jgi:plasmid maintenance system antidote protein VapI